MLRNHGTDGSKYGASSSFSISELGSRRTDGEVFGPCTLSPVHLDWSEGLKNRLSVKPRKHYNSNPLLQMQDPNTNSEIIRSP